MLRAPLSLRRVARRRTRRCQRGSNLIYTRSERRSGCPARPDVQVVPDFRGWGSTSTMSVTANALLVIVAAAASRKRLSPPAPGTRRVVGLADNKHRRRGSTGRAAAPLRSVSRSCRVRGILTAGTDVYRHAPAERHLPDAPGRSRALEDRLVDTEVAEPFGGLGRHSSSRSPRSRVRSDVPALFSQRRSGSLIWTIDASQSAFGLPVEPQLGAELRGLPGRR
jgi:hypothetical protein